MVQTVFLLRAACCLLCFSRYATHHAFADPFHYQCGIDFVCPGCGVKTGVFNLLRGNVEGAVRCNPFSVAVILAAVFSVVDTFVGLIRK